MEAAHQTAHTLAHAETMVASAAALQSGAEWNSWHDKYVRLLVDSEDEARLREVCEGLIKPPVPPPGGAPAEERGRRMYLGQSKRKMLGESSTPLEVSLPRCDVFLLVTRRVLTLAACADSVFEQMRRKPSLQRLVGELQQLSVAEEQAAAVSLSQK